MKSGRLRIPGNALSAAALSAHGETATLPVWFPQELRPPCLRGTPLFQHCNSSSVLNPLYVTLLDIYSSVKDIKEAEEPMFVQP